MSEAEQMELWTNVGMAIHNLENNIDLTQYELDGKPTQFFNLLSLFSLVEDDFN